MVFVQPAIARFAILEVPEGVRILIPARRSWLMIVFGFMWLGAWTFGGVTLARELTYTGRWSDLPATLVGLVGWTGGEIVVGFSLAWTLCGREVVCAKQYPSRLSVQWHLWGVQLRSREYDCSQVRHLRVSPESENMEGRIECPVGTRNIAFDYGAATQRIGGGLDDAEARIIVAALEQCCPSMTS